MDKDRVIRQLHRIEGQLRGIENMIATDRGMVATVQQLMAARASLKKLTNNYVQLFMLQTEGGNVELTPEQVDYILRLLES